ncbi:hypothetical protein COLO4_31931 [Corchorus olitorius]|uniref:Uncharacterized protein n=1 Tax=Corchorus olitorius TaxID=93759 RepID=A0A1R3H2Y2_9ROSI|nr:hypothetical protein COLO4_31931 [Corchorus olitorius]
MAHGWVGTTVIGENSNQNNNPYIFLCLQKAKAKKFTSLSLPGVTIKWTQRGGDPFGFKSF